MAENEIKVRLQSAYKTESEWTASNPILKEGEVGYVADSNVPNYGRYKIGDGATAWKNLPWGDQNIQEKFDDLEIGGRNLLLNSEFKNSSNYGIFSFSDGVITMNSSEFGKSDSNTNCKINLSGYSLECMKNKEITVSFEYYIESEITYGTTAPWVGAQIAIFKNSSGTNQWFTIFGGKNFPTSFTGNWVKVSRTFKVTDYDISSARFDIYFEDTKGIVKFRHIKLEIGNKATDWTPAPEDKADVSHTHPASDISSGILSSDRLPTIPVSKGGTGLTSLTSGQALIGNGTGAITTRAIDTTSGGTSGSTSLITSGAVYSGLSGKANSSHSHSYLPLSGGTLSTSTYYGLTIKRSDTNGAAISYQNSSGAIGGAGFLSDGYFQVSSGNNTNGNIFKANTTSAVFPGTVSAPTFTGALNGNANSATKLLNARTINGTSFDGSANITTANWGTARTLTIGNKGKSVNGSDNVSWSFGDIVGIANTSSPSNTYAKQYTKFARIDISASAWLRCCGIFNFISSESNEAFGSLAYFSTTGNSISTASIALYWISLSSTSFKDCVHAVKVSDGIFDLYYQPPYSYDTVSITNISCSAPNRITMYSGQGYVESITAVATSLLKSLSSSCTGNSVTASKLETARTISLAGSVTGSGTFDGSGDLSITTTTNHTHNYAGSNSVGGAANSALGLTQNTISNIDELDRFSVNDTIMKYAKVSGCSIGWVSNDGLLISLPWSSSYGAQIAIDDQSNWMALRTKSNGTWNSWSKIALNTDNVASATKASQDASGNTITSSYAASLSVSGQTLTLKSKSGATLSTVTTQDTTYSAVTRSSNGLMIASDKVKLDGLIPLTDAEIDEIFNEATSGVEELDSIYPVGSVYISINHTNPGTIFGGTWERFGNGKVLVGVDENDTDFSTAEQSGGEKTHTLTTAEMPSHSHTRGTLSADSVGGHTHSVSATAADNGDHYHHMNQIWSSGAGGSNAYVLSSGRSVGWRNTGNAGTHGHSVSGTAQSNGGHSHTISGASDSTGNGKSHNNLQPYITVYMWLRTA